MNEFVQIDIDEYRRLIELSQSRMNQIDGLSVALAKSQSKYEKLLKEYISAFGYEHLINGGKTIDELADLTSVNCFIPLTTAMRLMVMGFTESEISTAIRLAVEEAKRGTEQ